MTEAQQPDGHPAIRTIAMPADTNPSGDIFGGWLMAQIGVGRSSIKVFVEAWRRPALGESSKVTEATFVFVAIGPDGRPRPVDPV